MKWFSYCVNDYTDGTGVLVFAESREEADKVYKASGYDMSEHEYFKTFDGDVVAGGIVVAHSYYSPYLGPE